MKTTLAHWLTILTPYRSWLLILALLMLAAGWYLGWSSQPIHRWDASELVRSLNMIPPHTLAVTTLKKTDVHPQADENVQLLLHHQNKVLGPGTDGARDFVSVSADGQWLAAATTIELLNGTAGTQGSIELWSVRDARLVEQIPVDLSNPSQLFQSVTLSQNGQRVGWVTMGNGVSFSQASVWDRSQHAFLATQRYAVAPATRSDSSFYITALLLHQPEPQLFQSDDQTLKLVQLTDSRLLYTLALPFGEYGWPTISADGSLMALGGDGFVNIRQVSDGQLLKRFPSRKSRTLFDKNVWQTTRVFSPDNRYLLVAASTSRTSGGDLFVGIPDWSWPYTEPAVLWDLQTGQVVQRFAVQPDGATMLAYSPDGQYVATARGNEVRVFQVAPQLPYLQPLCMGLGLALLLLVLIQGIWLRR